MPTHAADVLRRTNVASWLVDRHADRVPGAIAIRGERAITYGELRDLVNRAGHALREQRCGPGDRVLLCLPDSVEFVAAFLGAAKIGAIPVAVDPWRPAADYAFYIADAEPRAAVVHAAGLSQFLPPAAAARIAVMVVDGRAAEAGATFDNESYSSWSMCLACASPALEAYPVTPSTPCCFIYTSGSTGRQKAVVHPHKNLIAVSRNVALDVFAMTPADCILSVPRLTYSFGLGCGMYFPFSSGASTVLIAERPQLRSVADTLARHRPTIVAGVPTFWEKLLGAAESWLPVDFSSVRLAISAGEPLRHHLFDAFRRQGIDVLDGLGSTEMLHFMSNRIGGVRPGSCGVEVPGIEVQLRDGDGRTPVPTGEIGTLWVRGETAFSGYWRRPEQSRQVMVDGWITTGDTLYRDDDGNYYHCGRNDDMLKVAGFWVSPRDVEIALLEHAAVSEAMVTTRDDEGGRRRLVAYIVPKPGAVVNEDALLRHAADRLPAHMLPAACVSLATLPLTPNGKISRSELPQPVFSRAALPRLSDA